MSNLTNNTINLQAILDTVNALPEAGTIPSGTIAITKNGTHDVTNYASAEVNVESSGGTSVETCKVTITSDIGLNATYTTVIDGVIETKYATVSVGSPVVLENVLKNSVLALLTLGMFYEISDYEVDNMRDMYSHEYAITLRVWDYGSSNECSCVVYK